MDCFGDDDDEEEENGGNVPREILTSAHALSSRPKSSGVLAFHNGTEESMLIYVNNNAERGNPKSVLKAVDDFCYSRHWMMHIGDQKLPNLLSSIAQAIERSTTRLVCIELGSYCGYSTIATAMNLREDDIIISLDIEKSCTNWSKRLLQMAGLDNKVKFITGTLADENCVAEIEKCLFEISGNISAKDMCGFVFIDHAKDRYLSDLITIEKQGWMKSGCIVVADNVLSFGKPLVDYLTHVRNPSGSYSSSVLYEGYIEYAVVDCTDDHSLIDGLEVSIFK